MFDFGLAKELKTGFQVGVGQYRGSRETGSRRYMAPEMYNSELNGLPADVYSYTAVCWKLLSMKNSWKGLDMKTHAHDFMRRNAGRKSRKYCPRQLYYDRKGLLSQSITPPEDEGLAM